MMPFSIRVMCLYCVLSVICQGLGLVYPMLELVFSFFCFNFCGWGETESTWYVSLCWPIAPALDDI
jgi:hypothetical protein